MRKCSVFLAMLAIGVMMPLTVMAQDGSDSRAGSNKGVKHGSFTNEQLMLNNRAVEAVINKEFKKAEKLYEALLTMGEFNVVWFQIARTYTRENKCVEAYDAFSHVASAPILDDEQLTPEKVSELTEKGLSELEGLCSSKVVFRCSPAEMTLSVDGGVEFECSDKPIPMVPGKHAVYAKTSFGFNSTTVVSVAGQQTEAKVEVVNYEDLAMNAGMTVEELEKKSSIFKIVGYSLLGAGVVGAGVSGGLMGYYYFDYKKQYDNQATQADINKLTKLRNDNKTKLDLTYGFLAAGSAMAVTGAVLLIVDAVKIQPQLEYVKGNFSTLELSPVVSPEFSGMALSGRF